MLDFKVMIVVVFAMLAICWSSVLVAMLIDKISGTRVTNFCRESTERIHVPAAPALAWWKHLLRLPLYCIAGAILVLSLVMFIPPMWLVTKLGSRKKTNPPNQSSEPTPPSVTDRAGARSAPAGGAAHL